MKFQIGQPIVWATNMDDPSTIKQGTVQKLHPGGEFLQYGDKAENSVHSAYVFPARAEAHLREVLTKRQALKKAYDDSMKLIYELRNSIIRGEI